MNGLNCLPIVHASIGNNITYSYLVDNPVRAGYT